jgi:ATP-binding cassette subfamily F protein uup
MNNLISLDNVSLAFGLHPLLNNAKLQIEAGERVCLIGRNGEGKSTLLKIIEGEIHPDSGEIWRKPSLRIARLSQDLPQQTALTVYEFVSEGLAETGKLLSAYHALTHRLSHSHTDKDLKELEILQQKIDAQNGWHFDQFINTALSRLELNPEQRVNELSGGWQRRAALARALVTDPELLLLDEPTNHLDIAAIQWLEDELMNCKMGLLFITHDRALLQRLATRIIELDRGNLTSWPGDYQNFLRRKEELLHAEDKQNQEFDKKLAQEEKWIRQGIKARRTRNEGRVRALQALRKERGERRDLQGKATFNLNEAQKSGRLVIEAENISQAYEGKTLIKNFSVRIMRGDRIGLIGPNGAGKSTLLNILLKKISSQEGTVTLGTKLEVAYFDQLRQSLDLEKTVIDNISEGREFIEIEGQRKHIISYLGDFLFTPQRAQTKVKALSGGECNRLVLAKLFSQPANLLILDEPTNDLDIETLELLEELLSVYQGTLMIVSHDRAFLDNVVTSTLVFEGEGKIKEYIGGYQDWIRQREKIKPIDNKIEKLKSDKKENIVTAKKLNSKEQKELANLPREIEKLETEQNALHSLIGSSTFYQQPPEIIAEKNRRLKEIELKLAEAYRRWEELLD